jgi:hypothetical protein
MKWWVWASASAAVAVGVAVILGKDDIAHFQRMHRM